MFEAYYALREKRLQLQREVDALEQQEKDLLYEICKPFSHADRQYLQREGIYLLKATSKVEPLVQSWPDLLGHIRNTGELDLFQKRVTASAVKARWDSGLTIPGIEPSHKWAVTITKVEA